MEEIKSSAYLATEKPGTLLRKYSLPCVVSLLVGALYNIVDQLFIANAAYLGSNGNAANTVVFPLTVVALAAAVLIGDGCCAFVSLCLGSGRTEDAHRCVGNAVLLSLAAGAALTAVYAGFGDALLTLFGGRVNDETFALAKEYFAWITAGIPFYVFGQAMNPVIRSDGSPRFAMAATLTGALLNLVLDPLMIFPLHWGMTGAAVATVIGQAATALLSLGYLLHMKSIRLRAASFRPSARLMGRFLPLGLCSLLSQLSLVAAMAAVNNMVRVWGAADPVFGLAEYAQIPMAVIGIVMKFFQIVISVAVGLAAGCIPVAGYNVGAGLSGRVRELFIRLLAIEAGVGAAALLVAELLPRQLIGVFGAAGESAYYTEFAVHSFRVYLCTLPLACVDKATFIYLQALGRAWSSTLLSVLREIVLGVGLALLLPCFLGLDGVLWSMPAADVLTFAVSAAVAVRTCRALSRPLACPAAA